MIRKSVLQYVSFRRSDSQLTHAWWSENQLYNMFLSGAQTVNCHTPNDPKISFTICSFQALRQSTVTRLMIRKSVLQYVPFRRSDNQLSHAWWSENQFYNMFLSGAQTVNCHPPDAPNICFLICSFHTLKQSTVTHLMIRIYVL